ncbi:MAG: hypothetical protein WC254_04525 [Candidatus Woesearchaeota archaeon]|jgi:hypothetical protein
MFPPDLLKKPAAIFEINGQVYAISVPIFELFKEQYFGSFLGQYGLSHPELYGNCSYCKHVQLSSEEVKDDGTHALDTTDTTLCGYTENLGIRLALPFKHPTTHNLVYAVPPSDKNICCGIRMSLFALYLHENGILVPYKREDLTFDFKPLPVIAKPSPLETIIGEA